MWVESVLVKASGKGWTEKVCLLFFSFSYLDGRALASESSLDKAMEKLIPDQDIILPEQDISE